MTYIDEAVRSEYRGLAERFGEMIKTPRSDAESLYRRLKCYICADDIITFDFYCWATADVEPEEVEDFVKDEVRKFAVKNFKEGIDALRRFHDAVNVPDDVIDEEYDSPEKIDYDKAYSLCKALWEKAMRKLAADCVSA